jgi:hypothetical protein
VERERKPDDKRKRRWSTAVHRESRWSKVMQVVHRNKQVG